MAEPDTTQEPWVDPIVAEVRQARERLFAAAGYDIHEFCRRLQERQEASGHRIVRAEPRSKTASADEAA